MKCILIVTALAALVGARPETYREKEDFQYARSSSDEGSKSGFYGAQRGNMGGNYEHAHNMDSLAQNQMSGLVRQTEGELGDGANTKTGSVYSAANSRGIYGSGHYDLSNLAGRNFQEGVSYDGSQSSTHSSSSSAFNNAAYTNSQSQSTRYGGYQAAGRNTAHSWQSGDLQVPDQQISGAYDYGKQGSQTSGYRAQSGYQAHNEYQSAYDQSNVNSHAGSYGSNTQSKLIAIPVRVVLRPGTRVAVPIATQTYDGSQGSLTYDQSSVNTEAEELSNSDQHVAYRPINNGKHYESSYKYSKQWEKHDTIPSSAAEVTSTDNPFTTDVGNMQTLTSDNQYGASDSESQSSNSRGYRGYDADLRSSSSQLGYNTGYNSQQHQSSSASNSNSFSQADYNAGYNSDSNIGYNTDASSLYNTGSNAAYNSGSSGRYKAGSNADLNSQVENINTKPKSYQSSYSYHKSWERQGDPYVIKPASSGYTGTKSSYGSGSHQSQIDCGEVCGHLRLARSYDATQYQDELNQNIDNGQQDLTQQTQNGWNTEDLGQQTQNKWDKLEDLGQQAESTWDQQQIVQHTQNQLENLENVGQQPQSQWNQLEDLGQVSQSTWNKYEDLGQQTQNKWDQQLNQNTWERAEELGQQSQNVPGQQTQESWSVWDSRSLSMAQQNQNAWNTDGLEQTQQTANDKYIHQIEPVRGTSHIDRSSPTREQSGINSFWNKLNQNEQQERSNSWGSYDTNHKYSAVQSVDIRTESPTDFNKNNFSSGIDKSQQHSNSSQERQHTSALSNFWKKFDSIEKNLEISSNKNSSHTDSSHDITMQEGWINSNHNHPQDIGRGDIGADEIPSDLENDGSEQFSNKYNDNFKTNIVDARNKTQDNSERNDQVSGIIYTQHNVESHNSEAPSTPTIISGIVGSETVVANVSHHKTEIESQQKIETFVEQNAPTLELGNKNLNQEDNYKQQNGDGLGNFGQSDCSDQEKVNLEQHNTRDFEQQNGNFDQNLQTINQQNENMKQQNIRDYGQLYENFDQNENQQNINDFGQQPANFDQSSGFRQPAENFEQNLQAFNEQTENLQNIHPLEEQAENFDQSFQRFHHNSQNFERQPGNFEQNLQSFDHHNDVDQENVNDFGQQIANFEQSSQNMGPHNIQDFGQPSESFEQNLQEYDQQNKNLGQHFQTVDQQNGNLQDFGQQSANFGQSSQIFDQHSQGGKIEQNIDDFGQQTANFDQSSIGQPAESFEQNLQGFDEQIKNLDPENIHDFGQQSGNFDLSSQIYDLQNHRDFEQQAGNFGQSLQSFDQQEKNLNQPNLNNLRQQTANFDQSSQIMGRHNIQDFGQAFDLDQHSQNLDQENIQEDDRQNKNLGQNLQTVDQQNGNLEQEQEDFGQQSANFDQSSQIFDQYNIQDYKHGGNIEQNLQSFDQQNEDVEQQNVPTFGHTVQDDDERNSMDQQYTNNHWEEPSQSLPHQHFDDFIQKKSLQNVESSKNLGQQVQTDWDQKENWVPHPYEPKPEKMEVLPISAQEQFPPKTLDTEVPPEPVTEKPGFWKSVSNKLSSAKDKVASWFSSG